MLLVHVLTYKPAGSSIIFLSQVQPRWIRVLVFCFKYPGICSVLEKLESPVSSVVKSIFTEKLKQARATLGFSRDQWWLLDAAWNRTLVLVTELGLEGLGPEAMAVVVDSTS
uniref:Uncharacterized protein LOC105851893 n=1 Tax=Cicer arietinum TaxID=3827 RepID=A0A1S3E422_CICAR|nr:uncharacterized protein LOC105851893 [Cicer arietinum]